MLSSYFMSRSALVLLGVLVFLALHQDVWFWDDQETLIAGFLPVGLAYHAVYTLAVAGFWWWAVQCAWPKGLDDDEGTTENGAE